MCQFWYIVLDFYNLWFLFPALVDPIIFQAADDIGIAYEKMREEKQTQVSSVSFVPSNRLFQ